MDRVHERFSEWVFIQIPLWYHGYMSGPQFVKRLFVSVYVQIPLCHHCYMSGPQFAKSISILKFIFVYLHGTICYMPGPQFAKTLFVSVYVQIPLWHHCYMPGPQFAKILFQFMFRYLCGTIVICLDHSLQKVSAYLNLYLNTFVVPFIVCLDQSL